jgi:hypothetical protein
MGGSLRLCSYNLQLLFAPIGAHCRQGCLRSQGAPRIPSSQRFKRLRPVGYESIKILYFSLTILVEAQRPNGG